MDRAAQRILEVQAYAHYTACREARESPEHQALYRRITHPQVGDLVLEISTIRDPSLVGLRLGRLERVAIEESPVSAEDREWYRTHYPTTPLPSGRFWYLRLIDGRLHRWYGARFITVLTDLPGASDDDSAVASDPSLILRSGH